MPVRSPFLVYIFMLSLMSIYLHIFSVNFFLIWFWYLSTNIKVVVYVYIHMYMSMYWNGNKELLLALPFCMHQLTSSLYLDTYFISFPFLAPFTLGFEYYSSWLVGWVNSTWLSIQRSRSGIPQWWLTFAVCFYISFGQTVHCVAIYIIYNWKYVDKYTFNELLCRRQIPNFDFIEIITLNKRIVCAYVRVDIYIYIYFKATL